MWAWTSIQQRLDERHSIRPGFPGLQDDARSFLRSVSR